MKGAQQRNDRSPSRRRLQGLTSAAGAAALWGLALLLAGPSVLVAQSATVRGVGGTTYQDPGQPQRIYSFVADDNLKVNYWNGFDWLWANQGPGIDSSISGKPAVVSYREAGARKIHAYVRSREEPFGLHVMRSNVWTGSQWQWINHGQPGAVILNSNQDIQSDPAVVSFPNGTGTEEVHAFALARSAGDSSPRFSLWTRVWSGSSWSWTDLGRPSRSVGLASAPSAVDFQQGGESSQRMYVFVNGADNKLYLSYRKNGVWRWVAQGSPPDISNGDFVYGTPAAITYRDFLQPQRIYAFINGPACTLVVNFWNGTSWQWADQGRPAGVSCLLSSPSATSYLESEIRKIHVSTIGNDGRHYANVWTGSQWQWLSLGHPPGTTLRFNRSPEVETYVDDQGRRRIYVTAMAADGNLYVNYKIGADPWRWRNQGAP